MPLSHLFLAFLFLQTPKPGSVSGTVTNAVTGGPVRKAHVTLHANEQTYTATTDAEGHYTVAGVTPGILQAQVDCPGFQAMYGREPIRVGRGAARHGRGLRVDPERRHHRQGAGRKRRPHSADPGRCGARNLWPRRTHPFREGQHADRRSRRVPLLRSARGPLLSDGIQPLSGRWLERPRAYRTGRDGVCRHLVSRSGRIAGGHGQSTCSRRGTGRYRYPHAQSAGLPRARQGAGAGQPAAAGCSRHSVALPHGGGGTVPLLADSARRQLRRLGAGTRPVVRHRHPEWVVRAPDRHGHRS